jgi:hypothetical protein
MHLLGAAACVVTSCVFVSFEQGPEGVYLSYTRLTTIPIHFGIICQFTCQVDTYHSD